MLLQLSFLFSNIKIGNNKELVNTKPARKNIGKWLLLPVVELNPFIFGHDNIDQHGSTRMLASVPKNASKNTPRFHFILFSQLVFVLSS